ncbi:NnrU family protein [Oleiagrimonas sp. C23AA]|uniref:NnrU family protein n=1 Tax=Oleiagrimonas sp. C23AA TaxID=2719047 RepID=UPI00142231F4|nr:NnrU family protein [Oleiagrimonas sp. C23AA]NII12176.1 NnrU family protein [Oleiagrimonas sp. C23AA]
MTYLLLGLALFLGTHSIAIAAPRGRERAIARLGARPWKGLYSVLSLAGLVLICWGFHLARQQPVLLYLPPLWLRHINALFTLIGFVLIAAAYVPRNHLKARLGHPMVAGAKVWAFGHLLAIGFLRDTVLFGAFLIWAIVAFAVYRRRDRKAGRIYPAGHLRGDLITLVIGIAAWALFAFWLHGPLIGVRPFG